MMERGAVVGIVDLGGQRSEGEGLKRESVAIGIWAQVAISAPTKGLRFQRSGRRCQGRGFSRSAI